MFEKRNIKNMAKIVTMEFTHLGSLVKRAGENKIVFVVGTGRSGTHFMDSILNDHVSATDLNNGKENPIVFGCVTDAALKNQSLDRRTIRNFKLLKSKAGKSDFIDQSHPNLWHVEQLIGVFPDSKFVAMVRCPYSVAYSTLNLSGVKGRLKNHSKYPLPNRFLEIEKENLRNYESLGLPGRSALRWCSHINRIVKVKAKYKDSVYVMNYENLCQNPNENLRALQHFLGYEKPFDTPQVNSESLDKRKMLSEADRHEIHGVLVNYLSRNKSLEDNPYVSLTDYVDF